MLLDNALQTGNGCFTNLSHLVFNFLGMLVRALESDWAVLCEEIGLWIPAQVSNKEHDDKPEGAEEFGNISFFSRNIHFLFLL